VILKYYSIFLIALLPLVSCKTEQLYLNVVEPAPVYIPSIIKYIGIINRYSPTDKTKVIDAIDKTLSLEGKNLDKNGAMESIKGLTDELLDNDRFTLVKPLTEIDLRTSNLTMFPEPLKWELVDQICKDS
jgi:hypothetical protein